jgi:glycosyltransferase involved in cell wall biosynthesis
MIKLAHITTAYQSVVTILDSKLRTLNKYEDLDITAISSTPVPALSAYFHETNKSAVKFIPVPMARTVRPLMDTKSIWQLYKVLKKGKFDIVHSHTAKAGFITVIAAKMARIPFVCHTYHGLPFYEGQNKISYLIYRFLEKIACRFRDYVFTQNKRDLPECVKLMGNGNKVLFEGNGVDIEFVKQSAQKQLPQAVGEFPGTGTRCVLLSRLEPVKRIDDFFRVIDKLRQEGLKVSCAIAGTGILEEQLKKQLAIMQLEDCVNMVGFINYPHGLIAASDIVVLCSEKEGIPRVIMEAMALQKPVVATDVLGTQELVVNGKTGFLVPLGAIDEMAEKIKLLAEDLNLREKMGSYGLKRISEEFNEIEIIKTMHQFYKLKTSKPDR